MNYDTEKFPRLQNDVADPNFGIGSLCINDLEGDPMGVMLQGKMAAEEIVKLRQELKDRDKKIALIHNGSSHEGNGFQGNGGVFKILDGSD